MKKSSKIVLAVVSITVALVIAIVFIVMRDLRNYIDNVPKIEPSEVVEANIGDTLNINDLASIKQAKTTKIKVSLDDPADIKISDDENSIYVGTKETSFDVTVYAQGSEVRTENVRIEVK